MTVNTKKQQKGAIVKTPPVRFSISFEKKEDNRILKAQKATPIKNKTEFIRILVNEALIARGF